MSKTKENSPGFTLIELMVVVVLTAIIGLALASTFQAGMNVWKRVAGPHYAHYKAVLGLERLSKELRSIYFYLPLELSGGKTHVKFVNLADDKIYQISYSVSPQNKCLVRSRQAQQQKLRDDKPSVQKIILGVKDFSLRYTGFYRDPRGRLVYTNGDVWNSHWGVPLTVRFDLTLEDGTHFEKTIFIPIAAYTRIRR